MKPRISIIVPVYNVKQYLQECVESLVNQSYENIEIILVDDGSTDGSEKICDAYSEKYSNVITIHQKNAGVSQARNNGIRKCTGEWITFCDSDDWCDLKMCENIAKRLDDNVDILVWGFTYYENGVYSKKEKIVMNNLLVYKGDDTKLLQLDLFTTKFDEKAIGDTNVILGTCWGRLYRKNIILKNNIVFIDGLHPHEDSFFNFLAFEYARNIHVLHESYNFYRIIGTSGCQRYKPHEGDCINNAIELLNSYITKYGYISDERFKAAFSSYCLTLFRIYLRNLTHPDNPQTDKEKIETLKVFLCKGEIKKGIISYPQYFSTTLKDKSLIFLVKYNMFSIIYKLKK